MSNSGEVQKQKFEKYLKEIEGLTALILAERPKNEKHRRQLSSIAEQFCDGFPLTQWFIFKMLREVRDPVCPGVEIYEPFLNSGHNVFEVKDEEDFHVLVRDLCHMFDLGCEKALETSSLSPSLPLICRAFTECDSAFLAKCPVYYRVHFFDACSIRIYCNGKGYAFKLSGFLGDDCCSICAILEPLFKECNGQIHVHWNDENVNYKLPLGGEDIKYANIADALEALEA